MKIHLITVILVCVMVLASVSAYAGNYDYIDPSILNGSDELPWITLVAVNDAPAWDDMTMDMLFLEQTGEKYAVPEDPAQRVDWMRDIYENKTGGKGDFALAKCSEEDFLRAAYDLDEWTFYNYQFHRYSDYTRIMIDGLTAYVYWSTGTDGIQHGAKAVYDVETGMYTVTEFNLLTMDGSPSDAIAAAYFGYLRNTCNYAVETQSDNLLFRAEPSGEAEIIAKIPKGGEVSSIFDYVYHADNGYDYVPARYDMNDRSYYGWIAMEYLGMNDRVDAITWVGRKPTDLEYPSAAEIMEAEGKEAVSLEVTVANEPTGGETFKEDEQVIFVISAMNNTFTTIDRAELADVDDVVVSLPWRQTTVIEVGHVVTADEAAAGSFEQAFSMTWTDDAGEHCVDSDTLTIPVSAE